MIYRFLDYLVTTNNGIYGTTGVDLFLNLSILL